MGLPLIKQIVTEHLGEIQVESETGKGTTFKITFPVRWKEKSGRFIQ
jgi:signal transduction histidine kinase